MNKPLSCYVCISKRVSCLLIALLVLVSPLVSCASESSSAPATEQASETQPAASTEAPENGKRTYIDPELPDMDFEGYEFRIMNVDQASYGWLLTAMDAEEENGETINDAVYLRNRTIEDKYNVSITEIISKDTASVKTDVGKAVKAGLDVCDIALTSSEQALLLAGDGACLNIAEIPYIDLSKPYWDQAAKKDLSLNGNNYFLPGDISFAHYSATLAMFFNKKLIEDNGLESPYKLVKDGKWTFDNFYKLASQVSVDLDGNGTFDKNDQYGLLSLNFIIVQGFIASGGEKLIAKDENDMPIYNANTERFAEVFGRIVEIMHSGNLLFDADLAGNHRLQDTMFPGNQALFWTELVHWSKLLRSMDSAFGIIPCPKFDEAQDKYYSTVFRDAMSVVVPVTNQNLDRTGILIEALNAQSYITTIPAYYDIMLKTKISRDEESSEMLDIIFDGRVYDMGTIYWTSKAFDPMTAQYKKNETSVAAVVEKSQPQVEQTIAKAMEAFQ
ncbi:MAG: hypothetical protein AB9835_04510 [Eubacteriales bacterium]